MQHFKIYIRICISQTKYVFINELTCVRHRNKQVEPQHMIPLDPFWSFSDPDDFEAKQSTEENCVDKQNDAN